jgi:hypothetical protein
VPDEEGLPIAFGLVHEVTGSLDQEGLSLFKPPLLKVG